MHRLLIVTVLSAGVSGCAMQMPSLFEAFDENKPAPQPVRSVSAEKPKVAGEKKEGESSTLGSFWDTLSSPFSGGSESGQLATNVNVTPGKLNVAEAQSMINAYRAKFGIAPLRLNPKLTEAARMQAEDLAKHDRISHYGSDGSDVEERARRAGYSYHLLAENIGTGQVTAAEVIRGWQRSPGHNQNLLLADAEHMGLALVYNPKSEYKTFWALVVGKGT